MSRRVRIAVMGEASTGVLTIRSAGAEPSATLQAMAHRPYPNRERARRQVERHYGAVVSRAAGRLRSDAAPAATRVVDGFRMGEYQISTR